MKTAWNIAQGLDKLGGRLRIRRPIPSRDFLTAGIPLRVKDGLFAWLHGGDRDSISSVDLHDGCRRYPVDHGGAPACAGEDRFASIQLLRQHALALRSMPYDSILQGSYLTSNARLNLSDNDSPAAELSNPFNAGTIIEYTIGEKTIRSAGFDISDGSLPRWTMQTKPRVTTRSATNDQSCYGSLLLSSPNNAFCVDKRFPLPQMSARLNFRTRRRT